MHSHNLPAETRDGDMRPASATPEPGVTEGAGEPSTSYGQILRATSIVGGGNVLMIIIGLVKTKVLATLLGPAGIGLMGLLLGVTTTASTLFGLGLGSSGVREIAAAGGDPGKLSIVRQTLRRANTTLGVIGLLTVFAFRRRISIMVFEDASHSQDVGWMALAVCFSVVAAYQVALLQGMRRVADMVRSGLLGTVAATAVGIAIVSVQGMPGVRWFVLAGPACSVCASAWYVRRLPRPTPRATVNHALWLQWKTLAALGAVLMVTSLASSGAALAVRAIITRGLGIAAAGQFQAASAISMYYLALVLGAMAADYYPRITELVGTRVRLNAAVNDQLEIALILTAPILLAVIALAPVILSLLYSSEFSPAAQLMRWQIIGDVLKVASWTLGFMMLAHGDRKTYLALELSTLAVFIGAVYLLLPRYGVVASGIAFAIQYVYYLPLVWLVARRRYGFTVRRAGLWYLVGLLVSAVVVAALSGVSELAAAGIGVVFSIAAGIHALRQLARYTSMSALTAKLSRARTTLGRKFP